MTLSTEHLAEIIPLNAQLLLLAYSSRAVTGQIILNFNQGRIESMDCREHQRMKSPQVLTCAKCGAELRVGMGWRVRDCQPYCLAC